MSAAGTEVPGRGGGAGCQPWWWRDTAPLECPPLRIPPLPLLPAIFPPSPPGLPPRQLPHSAPLNCSPLLPPDPLTPP